MRGQSTHGMALRAADELPDAFDRDGLEAALLKPRKDLGAFDMGHDGGDVTGLGSTQ